MLYFALNQNLTTRYNAETKYWQYRVGDTWYNDHYADYEFDGYIFNNGTYTPSVMGNWSMVWDATKNNTNGTMSLEYEGLPYIHPKVYWTSWQGTHGAYLLKNEPLPKHFNKIDIDIQFTGVTRGGVYTPQLTEGQICILSSANVNAKIFTKSYPASRSVVTVDLSGYEEVDTYLAFRFTSNTDVNNSNSNSDINLYIRSIRMYSE